MLRVVLLVEPAPRVDGSVANLAVIGSYAEDLSVGRTVIADRANIVSFQHGRHGAQKMRLIANREVVTVIKIIGLAGLIAAFDRGNAAGEDEHNVLAKFGHIFLLAAAEAFAETNQQKQRADAPCNAKHGEKRTQLVRPQRGQRLPDDID